MKTSVYLIPDQLPPSTSIIWLFNLFLEVTLRLENSSGLDIRVDQPGELIQVA